MVMALCGYNISRARRGLRVCSGVFRFRSHFRPRMTAKFISWTLALISPPGRVLSTASRSRRILHPREFPEFTTRGPDDRALSASANETTIGNRPARERFEVRLRNSRSGCVYPVAKCGVNSRNQWISLQMRISEMNWMMVEEYLA